MLEWWDGEHGLFQEEKTFWERGDVVAHVSASAVDAARAAHDAREKRAARTAARSAATGVTVATTASSGVAGTSAAAASGPKKKTNRTVVPPQATIPITVEDIDIDGAQTNAPKQAPFSTPLQFVKQWPNSRGASCPISAEAKVAIEYLSTPTSVFPPGFPSSQLKLSENAEREKRWKDVYTLWEELKQLRDQTPRDRVPTRQLFVCHKGKAPAQRDAYDPQLDAIVNHLAIVVVDPMDTARGWDIGRIESIDPFLVASPQDRMCRVQWLIPRDSRCKLNNTWPDGWVGWKLIDLQKKEGVKREDWVDPVAVDCIMWSTAMRQSKGEAVTQLPDSKPIQSLALLCTKRIEQVWAQNEILGGNDFLTFAADIRLGLPAPAEREEPDTAPAD